MADRNTVIRGNQIKDGTITADELNVSVAGAGIVGGGGTALSVNVDDSTMEVSTDVVRVKDAGITAAKLAAAVAGDGLSGGAGTALAVNVDDTTIEINADSLRVKAGAIGANEVDLTDDYVFTGDIQVPAPVSGSSVVNKDYVDGVATGLDVKNSVRAVVVTNITLANEQTAGGVALVAGDRVLVMGQTAAEDNGIYEVVDAGVWVRAADADGSPVNEVTSGMFTFVEEGDGADNGYVLTTNDPIALGVTELAFAQFSGAGQVVAGDGLSKVGNTLNVNVTGACEIDTDAVDVKALGIDTARIANDAVDKSKVNADVAGNGLGQNVDGSLEVNVDDTSIEVNADSLRVKALGISNAMLAGSISNDKLLSIADSKLTEDYIKTSEVDDASIEFAGGNLNVKALGIATAMIANDAVDKTKVAADIAGAGLSQAVGGEFDVNVDDSSIEIDTDTLRVKALGITNAMLAGSIANDKLVDIADSKLVEDYIKTSEVDDASIEFAGGSLNVKALGITTAMIAADAVDKDKIAADVAGAALVQNVNGALDVNVDDSSIEVTADALNVKALGITNAMLAEDAIKESKLNATNAPTDGYVLSYNSALGNFTWISGTADSIKESDIVKSTVNAVGAETVLPTFSGGEPVLANSVQVFLNGLLQESGAGNDYTVAVATGVVTFLTALEAGDIVIMNGILDN